MLLCLIPTLLSVAFMLEDNVTSEFGDLGKLLLAGVLAAILLGITFTVVRMRVRDKKPRSADFISINANRHDESAK